MKIKDLEMHCGNCALMEFCGEPFQYAVCEDSRFLEIDDNDYYIIAENCSQRKIMLGVKPTPWSMADCCREAKEGGYCEGRTCDKCDGCEADSEAKDHYVDDIIASSVDRYLDAAEHERSLMSKEKCVLVSIKREYWEKILAGEKRYEYRKSRPRDYDVRYMLFYIVGKDGGEVVGQAMFDKVIKGSPTSIWNMTNKEGGISYTDYSAYTGRLDNIYAFHLNRPALYRVPIKLSDCGLDRPPLSWCYVGPDDYEPSLYGE